MKQAKPRLWRDRRVMNPLATTVRRAGQIVSKTTRPIEDINRSGSSSTAEGRTHPVTIAVLVTATEAIPVRVNHVARVTRQSCVSTALESGEDQRDERERQLSTSTVFVGRGT
jgi:hypothetical protein